MIHDHIPLLVSILTILISVGTIVFTTGRLTGKLQLRLDNIENKYSANSESIKTAIERFHERVDTLVIKYEAMTSAGTSPFQLTDRCKENRKHFRDYMDGHAELHVREAESLENKFSELSDKVCAVETSLRVLCERLGSYHDALKENSFNGKKVIE